MNDKLGAETLSPEEAREAQSNFLAEIDAQQEQQRQDMIAAGVPNEEELRNSQAPWPETLLELTEYIGKMVDRPHDYGTCVYAMSLSAVAAFNFAAKKLGVTGFQASCADMDIIGRIRNWVAFTFINYHDLLYPQYEARHRQMSQKTFDWLQAEATRLLLEDKGHAHPAVTAHWIKIKQGIVPHGFEVVDD